MKRMSKYAIRNICLIAGLCVIAITLFLVFSPQKESGASVTVYADGEVYGVYDLQTDRTVDVDGRCKIVIRDGTVSVTEATCHNQTCVHHVPVSDAGESIICLPNRVIVQVGGERAIDIVI